MRYEPDEKCPPRQALGAAFLIFIPNTISVVLLTTFVIRASGESENYLAWATFTGLAISGLSILLHAFPFRYMGSGGLVVTNLNVPLLAVSVLALARGGPGLLASLVITSTLLQFLLVSRLASLRRVFTPTVSGIVIMLVAASAVPFFVDRTISHSLGESSVVLVPGGVALAAGLWGAVQSSEARRLWTLPIAVASGLAVAVPLGLYDASQIAEAPWLSIADVQWPLRGLDFGIQFWSLLPAFLVVKLTAFLKVVGDLSIIHRASFRNPAALDFRRIQSGLNLYGATTLLTGLVGTLPVSAPWSSTAVYIGFTGIAARSVGIYLGLLTLLIAPFAKIVAVLAATPDAVVAAVFIIIFGLLFIEGSKAVFNSPMDYRKAVIVGVSMVLGISAASFGRLSEGIWGDLMGNTIIVGGVTAIGMTIATGFRGFWRRRLNVDLSMSSLTDISAFLENFASRYDWSESAKMRLNLAVEEVVLTLLDQSGESGSGQERRLSASVHTDGDAAEIELIVYSQEDFEGNIEDRLSLVSGQGSMDDPHQLSTLLLRHYASAVHHRKYYGADIVTCRVEKHATVSAT
jgi:xanthine/uracil permease